MVNYIKNILDLQHKRSKNVVKNILYSFLIKGGSIVVNLALVPLLIGYLSAKRYGIWITLSSVVAWFSFFDIGLGNGLRNKFTKAKSMGDVELAKIYVSTTYASLTIIIVFGLIVFYSINPFIYWPGILNTEAVMAEELKVLALIIFTLFSIRLVLQLLNVIIIADQQPAKASFINFISNSIILIVIYVLTKLTLNSLIWVGIILTGIPVFVLSLLSIWYFRGRYKDYRPSIAYIRLEYFKDLMGLGAKFFIIQIAAIVLYQTSTLIITQLFGPEEVTNYFIVFKYFSIVTMAFGIVIQPFWSAFTEALAINDLGWIKDMMKKLQLFWFLLVLGVIVMLVLSPYVYSIWIGKDIKISFALSTIMACYVLINTWNGIFSYFLNGVGKIKLQLYSGVFGMLINIPLAIVLGKDFGVKGVVLASCILGAINMIWTRLQYKKIITGTAAGIWAK